MARLYVWRKRAERRKNEGTNDDLVACEIIRRRIVRKKWIINERGTKSLRVRFDFNIYWIVNGDEVWIVGGG